MAFDFFSSRKKGEEPPKRDLGKAAKYFAHAETVAGSRQYDYAIELYVNGLRQDPDNVKRHEELREVAKRRKVTGGKPAGFSERRNKFGSDPISRMIHEEMLWSKNPIDDGHPLKIMEHAVEAGAAEPDLHMNEVAWWVGQIILETQRTLPKPNKDVLVRVSTLYEQIAQFDKAVEACRLAMTQDPQDPALNERLRNLETELTMAEGRYGEGKEGDFRQNIRDAGKQRELEEDDALSKSEKVVAQQIDRYRKAYADNPSDLDAVVKYVRALLQKEGEEPENQAIAVLQKAFDETGQYKFRAHIGDVRMQQMQRKLRAARQHYEANKDDPEARREAQQVALEVTRAELAEFADRAKAYPTDMRIRFELGRRYFALKQYDEAISEFQRSQGDPRHKPVSMEYLGRAYQQLGLLDVAINSLREGLEAHTDPSDRLGMELQYTLMDALQQSAREHRNLEQAVEAQKLAGRILQTNIKYRDIRARMDQLRELVAELRDGKAGAA